MKSEGLERFDPISTDDIKNHLKELRQWEGTLIAAKAQRPVNFPLNSPTMLKLEYHLEKNRNLQSLLKKILDYRNSL